VLVFKLADLDFFLNTRNFSALVFVMCQTLLSVFTPFPRRLSLSVAEKISDIQSVGRTTAGGD